MNFDVEKRTILRVRHGSTAYGTNIATSDLDIKGVCVEPMTHQLGFLHSFEQSERMVSKGHAFDEVIYSLKKFARLASDCNPNIIEILHVDDSDIIAQDEFGEELRSHRNAFLSKKVKYAFSGYAYAQLHRIKTHRKWLMNPPSSSPMRCDHGLTDEMKISKSDLGAYDSMIAQKIELNLPINVISLFVKEKAYQAAKVHYDQYINWKTSRNSARAELEAKFGFDTKHGMHLIRLMRMCAEILETGKVNVRRPDADELIAIRHGNLSYDQLIDEAEKLEKKCDVLYLSSSLPNEPDRNFLDKLVVDMSIRYCSKHEG